MKPPANSGAGSHRGRDRSAKPMQRYRIEYLTAGVWREAGHLAFPVPARGRPQDAVHVIAIPVDQHGRRLPWP